MKVEDKRKYIMGLLLTIAVITVVFIYFGNGKRITFCDEIYTYNIVNSKGLTPYMVGNWMSGQDFIDAFTQNQGDSFYQTIVNVKGDMVHPPLYYILMFISSKLAGNHISVWTGLAVNLIGYIGTAVIVFLILSILFENPVISVLGTMGVMLTQCMISDAMLVRMYMIYTLFTALLAYSHLRLRRKDGIFNYVILGVSVVGGFLTQYYFVFFIFGFFVFEMIFNLKEKKYKAIVKYVVTMIICGVVITLSWSFWIQAVTSSTHSEGILSNAKGFLGHLGKVYYAYELIMAAVFQRAYKAFMIIIPVLITAFLIAVSFTVADDAADEKKRLTRQFVVELLFISVMYAFIVNVLTPDYLSSTRYYYADMMLVLMLYVITIFGIAREVLDKLRHELKRTLAYGIAGFCVIVTNVILCFTGYGIDYYGDAQEYDATTQVLEGYKDIPWVIGWDGGWQLDTAMQDFSIPDRVIPTNINGELEKGTFDGVDEFILVQSGDESSELTTQKNIYPYLTSTGNNVDMEKIAARGYVSYYHCVATHNAQYESMEEYVDKNMDTLWLVINNDGWYEAKSIFPGKEPDNILFIDNNTAYDTTGKYKLYEHVIILASINGTDVKDVGTYYMIGSTGNFYGSSYVGFLDGGKVIMYSCDIRE